MEQLISFEAAKLVTYRGLTTTIYWYNFGGSLTYFDKDREDLIPAPSQSQLQKWLREEKRCIVYVTPIDSWTSWRYTILMEDLTSPFFEPEYDRFNEYKSYEEALEAGLKTALELI